MTALRYLIESHRQLRLFRKRAVPLAILVQDPPKLPLRQLEREIGSICRKVARKVVREVPV